jgi:toxin ParE1/3/4
MTYTVFILPIAEMEAAEASLYYEDQKPGLGIDFLDELDAAREHLSEHPQHYSFITDEKILRSIALKRFPYSLIFQIEIDKVIVISVHHEKQKPIE